MKTNYQVWHKDETIEDARNISAFDERHAAELFAEVTAGDVDYSEGTQITVCVKNSIGQISKFTITATYQYSAEETK